MLTFPQNLKYHEKHMWVREDGTTGVTDFAQKFLGEILEVRVKPVGTTVIRGNPIGEIESFKLISDLISPVSGAIIKVNEEALRKPTIINEEPYGKGWIAVIEMSNPKELDELLTSSQYEKLTQEYSSPNLW